MCKDKIIITIKDEKKNGFYPELSEKFELINFRQKTVFFGELKKKKMRTFRKMKKISS